MPNKEEIVNSKNENFLYYNLYNALDVHNWSGLGYHIADALEKQNNELYYIGELNAKVLIPLRLKSKFYRIFKNNTFDYNREPYTARKYAQQVCASLKKDTDIVFSPSTIPISLLDINKPKVFYTDATFAGMIGFYDEFSNLCQETIINGNFLEQKALESSSLAIYSSDWAAQTAIDNYKVNPNKIKVVPFGANIDCNRSLNDIKRIVSSRSLGECHLLFLAVDWKRKGGQKAISVAAKLNEIGIKTILHIAGIKNIPLKTIPDFVVNHGFISKSSEEGKVKLNHLLAISHFLILPTNADCTPVVFAEANSFGLPCISTNVGGISTIIKNNCNGITFSVNDMDDLYVEYIRSLFINQRLYKQLAYSSFNEFEKRLNWNVAGKTITNLLKEL